MTRTEYLAELDKYLKRLPEVDYQEAMDYFVEYFEEAVLKMRKRLLLNWVRLRKLRAMSSRRFSVSM